MRGSTLIAVVMLLVFIFACFLTVPVLAEGPWDSDNNTNGSDNGPNTSIDSTSNNGGEAGLKVYDDNTGGVGWLNDIFFYITIRVIVYSTNISDPVTDAQS